MGDDAKPAPTLFEWMGGLPAIGSLMTLFYRRVSEDVLLAPLFAHMPPDHVDHVARFVAEVLGGPKTYSADLGGHPAMIRKHLGRALTEEQRQQWMRLLLRCADECGVPDDPEFRSALVSYLEWGTRLAVINSQPGRDLPVEAPMPSWGWGVVGGPYVK
jgi:hemoglobin